MKIAILGYSGSGKSTLAKFLGETYKIPVLHLDTVQFIEDWEERNYEEGLAIVAKIMAEDNWVIDGNYTKFYQAERLAAADQIIFVQFSRWATLKRIIQRRIKYHKQSRPDMAEGCDEKLDWEFLWWVVYEGRTKERREHYQAIEQGYADKCLTIKNQKELDAFYQKTLKTS